MFSNKICTLLAVLMVCTGFMALTAQPSVEQLASQMQEANQQRLESIETLQFTTKIEVAGFETESVSRFKRVEENDSYKLVLDEGDDPNDDMMEGVYDGSMEELILAAESVHNDQVDGRDAYRVIIRDKEFLNSFTQNDLDAGEQELQIEKGTLWIDSSQLVPLKMMYEESENGDGMSIEITMNDYRDYSGLPVAHTMAVMVDGLDDKMSDEDIAEARRAMAEFEEQLESMPKAQRDMIRDRMSGQMEQFEQMLESGMASATTIEVVDVKINQ